MRKITQIFVYPIKSCRGVALQAAEVTPTGLRHDRQFVLVDDNGKFLSQRRIPKMCLIKTELVENHLIVTYPGCPSGLGIPLCNLEEPGTTVPVDIWGKLGHGIDVGEYASQWLSNCLGLKCWLLRYDHRNPRQRPEKKPGDGSIPLSFADGFPVLLIPEESLADLNDRMSSSVTMERFRPNIVVAGGNHAFEEDAWKIASAGGVRFTGEKPCERCSVPLIDPETGIPHECEEPIATLKTYRRLSLASGKKFGPVIFGKNLSVARTGTIRVGDVMVAS